MKTPDKRYQPYLLLALFAVGHVPMGGVREMLPISRTTVWRGHCSDAAVKVLYRLRFAAK
jgi:hypothetical protein